MAIQFTREYFSVLSELGRGAFGRVELVVAPDGTQLALKSFDPMPHALNISDRDRLRSRFCIEVEIQRSLPPEIALPVYCSDLEGDSPWFVMPVAQMSLRELLEDREGNLPYLQRALWDVLIALEFIHNEGYVHRDLKPENILLRDERWILSDFGLAKGNDFKGLTTSQSAWGTREYTSPEALTYFRRLKPQSDIYSFGCILHDCFGSKNPRIPYSQYNAEGPMGDVIKKCTALDYRERYKNVREVREAVFTALNELQLSPPSKESEEEPELFLAIETWINDEEKVLARKRCLERGKTDRWSLR